MKSFYEKRKRSINQMLVFIAAFAAALLFFKYALGIVAPFLAAFILSLLISPPVDLLTARLKIPRGLATIFSMLVVLLGLGLLLNSVLRLLVAQLISFSANLPNTSASAIDLFRELQQSFYDSFAIIPEEFRLVAEQTIMMGVTSITSWLGRFAREFSVSAVRIIPKTFVFILITIISTFFITKDKQKITSFVKRQFPNSVGKVATILKKDIFGALWGYIRAQLILMSFSGVIAVTGLSLLSYEYAFLFGVTVAFFDALPIFGPGFILWPWAAISFLAAKNSFGIGLLLIYLTIIFFRQMLEPKVVGVQIGIYPLVTLFSMYAGLMTLGALGLIAGPVLAIIIKSLQNADLLPNWK